MWRIDEAILQDDCYDDDDDDGDDDDISNAKGVHIDFDDFADKQVHANQTANGIKIAPTKITTIILIITVASNANIIIILVVIILVVQNAEGGEIIWFVCYNHILRFLVLCLSPPNSQWWLPQY